MKLRDSGENGRIGVKLNSEDHANNNFSDRLRKPGAILESDPYIRDADDKSVAESCLDQLRLIFTCACLQKKNQVLPVHGFHWFESHQTTSAQNGGHSAMGNGLTGTMKKTADHKRSAGTKDKLDENGTKDEKKRENDSKPSDGSDIHPTRTEKVEAGRNGVFTIPVEVNSKDKSGPGTGMTATQSQFPDVKAKENIEKIFKMSDDKPSDALANSHAYKSSSDGTYKQSTFDPSHPGRSKNSNLQTARKDNHNGAHTTSDFVDHSNTKSTDVTSSYPAKKLSTVNPAGSTEEWYRSQENYDEYKLHKNDPKSELHNAEGGSTSFGTSYSKNPHHTTDSSFKNQKTEKSYHDDSYNATTKGNRTVTDARGSFEHVSPDRQQPRQKHSESHKLNEPGIKQEFGMNYPGGQYPIRQKNSEEKWDPPSHQRESKNTEDYSDPLSRNFVDNYRKKADPQRQAQNGYQRNSQAHQHGYSDTRHENSDRDPGGAATKNRDKKSTRNHDENDFSERDSKFKEEKSSWSDKKNDLHKRKDFEEGDFNETSNKNSTGAPKNYPRDLGFDKNQYRAQHQIPENRDRNRRGNKPGPYRDESLSDDDNQLLEGSRQFQPGYGMKSTKNEETSILNPARLEQAEERDYLFSKGEKTRSEVLTRKNAWKSNNRDEPKTSVPSKDASRSFKSGSKYDDELKDSRAPPRVETPGDTVHNNNSGFSENRPNLNNYTASTSLHHRISQIAPMQPNDYMALPTHIVNLPDEEMDFARNDNVRVEKSLIKSVPHSKSYENISHKNGFGERFKYNSTQQRRQPETKSNMGSSLYPSTLQPFDSPKDALEKCLLQIESPEWEIVMQSLQGIVRLSRYHPEVLIAALHRIVTGLAKQIRSLRSQVTKAACVVSQELFEHLGKIMDPEIEELAPALLSRTCDANKFLQHDANSALDSMIDNVSPIRSATFLLVKGSKHRNAVVRTTACRLLARLCQNLGVEHVYSLPRDTRDSLLNTAAKFLLEGSLDTRAYAKEVFSVLARDPRFMRLMNEVVPAKTMEAIRKPLIKVISQK